ncbi:MAG: hypothetical protein M3082_18795 [Candidatus Dormibacteraeota bacterium]|nr:hypothetical protein [Candidatus Dormibacteraeota bacterium]
MAWEIRFYNDGRGEPFRDWLDGLTGKDLPKRLAAIAGIERVLARHGTDVCETEWGRNLGKGLYEFRIRHDAKTIRQMFGSAAAAGDNEVSVPAKILLRIFFTTAEIILLLCGYDKGKDPKERRQQSEITQARRMVADYRRRS